MAGEIRPLRTEQDYEAALAEAARLAGRSEGGAESDRLAVLGVLIADYERRNIRFEPAEPIEVVALDMRVNGRTQADLARVLGSRSRASELLAGRRALTEAMADRLSDAWSIPRELLGPGSSAKRQRRTLRAAGAAAILLGAVSVGGAAGHWWIMRDLPAIEPLLAMERSQSFVALQHVPIHVRQAFLAAEDSDFYRHGGASLRGLARATMDNTANVFKGRRLSGGGTITHQLVKGTLLAGEPRSLRRRLRELALGARIEAALPKDRILELYLNRLYFGGDLRGLRAASLHYFGVEPRDLSVSQAAMLAAMPSAPNDLRVDLAQNFERAHSRREWVLSRMSDEGYLTAAALDQANAAPLR